jgi:hypothetical protein
MRLTVRETVVQTKKVKPRMNPIKKVKVPPRAKDIYQFHWGVLMPEEHECDEVCPGRSLAPSKEQWLAEHSDQPK